MANMPGMRSSARAGRREPESAGSAGMGRRGNAGLSLRTGLASRNICLGLILHPRSFAREKSASAQGAG